MPRIAHLSRIVCTDGGPRAPGDTSWPTYDRASRGTMLLGPEPEPEVVRDPGGPGLAAVEGVRDTTVRGKIRLAVPVDIKRPARLRVTTGPVCCLCQPLQRLDVNAMLSCTAQPWCTTPRLRPIVAY